MQLVRLHAGGIVDVHSHIIPPEYIATLRTHDALMNEGFPLPHWDAEAQLEWMDSAGINCSVLTLCAPHPYLGSTEESAALIREVNEQCANLRNSYPGRFRFCAVVPLPDVEAAIREAIYAIDTLKADGIKLATNSCGQYLGDPALDPLMQVLSDRKAVVILHPHRPEPVNDAVMRQTPLAMQEYLSETTRAVANMISRNVLARFDGIKMVVPHCGAYLPLAVPRMKSLYPVMQGNGLVGNIDWEKNLTSLYFDLAGSHSPEVIKMMLTITEPSHLLYGSDYPYASASVLKAQLERMKRYLAEDPELSAYGEMVLSSNALRLFGETIVDDTPASMAQCDLIVRTALIEIDSQYIDQYLAAARRVGAESVKKEPGVVCIFPMRDADNPCVVRIVEIYRDKSAYQSHLQTAHFLEYKQSTLHMVRSLQLIDESPLAPEAMPDIFKKY